MKLLINLSALFTLLMFSSCSKTLTYFTEDLYDQHNWNEGELKRIQFYVSQDIVLYRSSSGGDSKIKDGQIQIKDNRRVEEIVIKRGTPGALMFMHKENRFAVSFDNSGDYLMFGSNEKAKGRFVLLAKKWDRRGKGGTVSYGETEYFTSSESAYASLMVDLKKAQKSEVKKETVGGRRVN